MATPTRLLFEKRAQAYSMQCSHNGWKSLFHNVCGHLCSGFETWPRKRGTPCLSIIATTLGWSKVTGTGGGPIFKQHSTSNIAVAAAASAPSSSTFNKMNRRAHERGVAILGITMMFKFYEYRHIQCWNHEQQRLLNETRLWHQLSQNNLYHFKQYQSHRDCHYFTIDMFAKTASCLFRFRVWR